ncbi:TPA_asm: hypothetical protein [Anelosimus tangle-web spider MELD virus]|nr:TPA_asm: hypothetical protein [Anelosimus tangle-web spider MELD virus]
MNEQIIRLVSNTNMQSYPENTPNFFTNDLPFQLENVNYIGLLKVDCEIYIDPKYIDDRNYIDTNNCFFINCNRSAYTTIANQSINCLNDFQVNLTELKEKERFSLTFTGDFFYVGSESSNINSFTISITNLKGELHPLLVGPTIIDLKYTSMESSNQQIVRLVSSANLQYYPNNNASDFSNNLSPTLLNVETIALAKISIPLQIHSTPILQKSSQCESYIYTPCKIMRNLYEKKIPHEFTVQYFNLKILEQRGSDDVISNDYFTLKLPKTLDVHYDYNNDLLKNTSDLYSSVLQTNKLRLGTVYYDKTTKLGINVHVTWKRNKQYTTNWDCELFFNRSTVTVDILFSYLTSSEFKFSKIFNNNENTFLQINPNFTINKLTKNKLLLENILTIQMWDPNKTDNWIVKDEITTTQAPPPSTADHIYVCMDGIENIQCGNNSYPILGIVPVFDSDYSEGRITFTVPFSNIYFLHPNSKTINSFRVKLLDENFKPHPFIENKESCLVSLIIHHTDQHGRSELRESNTFQQLYGQ